LSAELQQFDRVVLAAFAKQTGLLNEFLRYDGTDNEKFKAIFDQMIRVRNEYRRIKQIGESPQDLTTRALILLRLNPSCKAPKLLSDFVLLRNHSPESIVAIFKRQRSQIASAMKSFAFLIYLFQHSEIPLILDFVAILLAEVETFEGLASIVQSIRMSHNQKQTINLFFSWLAASSL
jgi:hypothetical protein